MAFNQHVILPQDHITDPHMARLVYRVRLRLGDNKPAQRLFAPKREIWDDYEILSFLYDELDEINVETPHTDWDLTDCPMEGLLVEGGMMKCMYNKIVKESEEFMQYSDGGLALTMNKYQSYLSSLQPLMQAHDARRKQIKQTFRPTLIGIGKQRIPFSIARPLSMLPNLKNTFGI